MQGYNMVLHYFNEFCFFFYICMCLTFTDFVDDVPTRQATGSVLSTFMFAILSFNVVVCLIALILTQKNFCDKSDLSEISDTILKRRVDPLASDRKNLIDSEFILNRSEREFVGDKTVLELEPQLLEPSKYQHQPSGVPKKKGLPDLDLLIDKADGPMEGQHKLL